MTSSFPNSVFSQRALANLPGIVFDGAKSHNLFAEDVSGLGDEITAIETEYLAQSFYFPTAKPKNEPNEVVISNLQSGHGFSKQSAQGTQTDDTVVFAKGTQSLKLVTDGIGSAVFTRKSSISPAINLTGKYLKVLVSVSDITNVTDLWVYASSNNFASAFYTWKISADITQLKNNTIVAITLPFGKAEVSGSPDRGAINAIQFRVKDANGVPVTANLCAISAIAEPTVGAVSITFDDGWLSQFTEAKKTMDVYNFPGTAYVIPDLMGTSGYMTLNEVKALKKYSQWDICAHYQTNLTTLTAGQAENAIKSVKRYLIANGFTKGVDHFAYPNGAYDESIVLPLVRKYFVSARTIATYDETIDPADYHKLRVFLVVNTTTPASIATAIDRARVNNEWLILVFHKIVTTPTVSTEYSIADFGTVIDDIAADGIAVKTVTSVLR